MRLGESPAPLIDGRRDRSAGSRRARADRENRRWPPGVVKTRRRPASLQRRKVAGETPSTRLASERPTQSGSRAVERLTTYPNLSEHHRLAHYTISGARSSRARRRSPLRRQQREAPRSTTAPWQATRPLGRVDGRLVHVPGRVFLDVVRPDHGQAAPSPWRRTAPTVACVASSMRIAEPVARFDR
jgi:hypothetical protein